jgi:hypothetical protein
LQHFGIECSHGTGARVDGREGNTEPVRASSPGASLVEVDALLPVQSLSGFMERVQELRDSGLVLNTKSCGFVVKVTDIKS